MENEKTLTKSIYKKQIGEYFDYSCDFDFLDIVAEILERIDVDEINEDNIYDAIYDAMDNIIYYYQQWRIIEHYQTPMDANFDDAMSDFENDLYNLVRMIVDQKE